MALYASNGKEYIFAPDAQPGEPYRCLECGSPVKARRGKNRIAHFYHLKMSPRCRLYSKSKDHLLIQLQIQKLLSADAAQIERPFFPIHRIADVLWEREKIAFEIQCSSLDLSEAGNRIADYRKLGYEIIWLLDDRIFNRRFIRPTEEFLRSQACYFFSFDRRGPALFYDQLEITVDRKRLRKGRPLAVDLSKPRTKPDLEWPFDIPEQIKERIERSKRYFPGDLIHKTVQAAAYPTIAIHLAKWHRLEIQLKQASRRRRFFTRIFNRFIARPYIQMLDWLLLRSDH